VEFTTYNVVKHSLDPISRRGALKMQLKPALSYLPLNVGAARDAHAPPIRLQDVTNLT
jgi:hypothetical protein